MAAGPQERGEATVHVEIHENCEDCDVKFSNTLKSFRGIRKVTVLSKYNYIVTASNDFDLNLLGAHLFKNTGRSVKLVPTATTCPRNDGLSHYIVKGHANFCQSFANTMKKSTEGGRGQIVFA
ncbi:unnamed protein product [Cuscuta campestris]|uniref:HMA domain-containing protein n=1 Tax=Cuscuta campestris TaxID=132261 RepID=A0A484KTI1_9ASTE|nr:unnamed protein product [Cuscuta campestris]